MSKTTHTYEDLMDSIENAVKAGDKQKLKELLGAFYSDAYADGIKAMAEGLTKAGNNVVVNDNR